MAPEESLPEGVHHYETAEDVPFPIANYWHQRYEIFSKYDEGVWMTDDAWFGVTPEPVAKYNTSLRDTLQPLLMAFTEKSHKT